MRWKPCVKDGRTRQKEPEQPETATGTSHRSYSGCYMREKETSTDLKPLLFWPFFCSQNFLLRNACNFLYHLKDVQLAYRVYVGLSLYQACSLFPEILMIIHEQDSVVFNACFSDHCSTGIVSKSANCLL